MNEIDKLLGLTPTDSTIDLGTEFNVSAEMYSNSNENKKRNMNKNRFQQSTDPSDPANENLWGQAPSTSSPPSAPSEKEDQGIPETEKRFGRRLNWQNDKIVLMHLQLSHIKMGDRYNRCKAYISIKTEDDTRYMIFMRSDLTTANDETMRGIKKDGDKVLQSMLTDVLNEATDDVFTGRVRYKVTKGQKIQKHHRKNLPTALLTVFAGDGCLNATLHLLGEEYHFVLNEELTKEQEKFYQCQGVWEDSGTLSMEDAFGG